MLHACSHSSMHHTTFMWPTCTRPTASSAQLMRVRGGKGSEKSWVRGSPPKSLRARKGTCAYVCISVCKKRMEHADSSSRECCHSCWAHHAIVHMHSQLCPVIPGRLALTTIDTRTDTHQMLGPRGTSWRLGMHACMQVCGPCNSPLTAPMQPICPLLPMGGGKSTHT